MATGDFIAVDWGSSNRRAWRVTAHGAEGEHRDARGLKALRPPEFPAAAAELRARLGDLPMLCAGMVGARTGWTEAPYVEAPAQLKQLVLSLKHVEPRTVIVPGVRTVPGDRADVMRGEEVALFGALALGRLPPDGVAVKPGTHAKWVRMEGGAIATFRTAMTGEWFDLLQDHSLLHGMLDAPVDVQGEAYGQALADGAGAHLPTALFGIRAAVLLGDLPPEHAAARASGLLIGADVAANAPVKGSVTLIAGKPQDALYGAALRARGLEVALVEADAAFLAGMEAVWTAM